MIIDIAARSSNLSIKQVAEVISLMSELYPNISFKTHFIETKGDKDKKQSLRDLDKTDFFTHEIDHFILNKKNYIGVHSAKDLPDPIHKDLKVVAFTKCLDSRDSIVTNKEVSFFELKKGSVVATSSYRREMMVKSLRSDLKFIDIRGTIEERLKVLESKKVDGVVIAEAALIRLNLTHLNRVILDSETVQGQGQLAVIANKDDKEMEDIFSLINYGLVN